MLIQNHEVFEMPEQPLSLWRYMDFTNLVSLLEHQALIFPRSDQFEDPYEGVFTQASVHQLRNNFPYASPQQREAVVRMDRTMRKELYVSCWCANDHESAAMWKLFLPSPLGVAIHTNTAALGSALEASQFHIGMGLVTYLDYETATIDISNFLYPVMHKRLSFAHEREFRAVIWAPNGNPNFDLLKADSLVAVVPVALGKFVDAVYVAPTAPQWFGALVEKVLERYELKVPVIRSALYDRPTY